MACSTRALVVGRTLVAPLRTRETVWWDTCAAAATSWMVGALVTACSSVVLRGGHRSWMT
ncbi:hypothetical protein NS184_01660 [Curtobacterium luteum]|uniref:Uncharacterized protein n=1 Tax=Curtobacterium luteum TaxID=33881 RepID=A0A175S1K8_9MICO|nr:hypothetical protein NS184_01660 [Curtobacterium luteum]